MISSPTTLLFRSAVIVSMLSLVSCGGGGSSNQPVSAAPNSVASFTYTKLTDINVGTNLDILARGLVYRETASGAISYVYGPLAASNFQTSIVRNSDGLIVVEFNAKNNGRRRTHRHLFMMDEKLLADEKGAFIPATVSNVPLDDWTALLEKSWGAIEGTHFFYA